MKMKMGEINTYDGKLIGEQFIYQISDNEGEIIEEEMPLTIVGIGKKPAKDWGRIKKYMLMHQSFQS